MLDQGAAIALVLARIAPKVAPCVEACRNFGMLGRVLINLRRCPLRSGTDRHCATAANVPMGHKRSSFNNDRAALIPSIARRRVGQVQPEDGRDLAI